MFNFNIFSELSLFFRNIINNLKNFKDNFKQYLFNTFLKNMLLFNCVVHKYINIKVREKYKLLF